MIEGDLTDRIFKGLIGEKGIAPCSRLLTDGSHSLIVSHLVFNTRQFPFLPDAGVAAAAAARHRSRSAACAVAVEEEEGNRRGRLLQGRAIVSFFFWVSCWAPPRRVSPSPELPAAAAAVAGEACTAVPWPCGFCTKSLCSVLQNRAVEEEEEGGLGFCSSSGSGAGQVQPDSF